MWLRDLVEVNEQGMLHNAINFGLMDEPETNLELCKSYIFNYDAKKPNDSTLGVLDRIRNSFHSANEPNVHCVVMQYGQGKSHLGVAIANFFEKPYQSPEVEGVLYQIKQATTTQPAIGERLHSFKKNSLKPYLVLCLSGDWGGNNIRQHILDQLLKTYRKANLDIAPLDLCAEPLRYLTEKIQASPAKQDQANTFLEENDHNYTVQSLIHHLEQNKTELIAIVKALYKHLEGFAPNFTDEINVDSILTKTIEAYCIGEKSPFKGLLIIFDELRYYLDLWKENPIRSGGNALQEITNVCERFQGRVALLNFTQVKLVRSSAKDDEEKEAYRKLTRRLSLPSATYVPHSSLELVLDSLLIQYEQTDPWKQFESKWRNTFTAEARSLYEGSGRNYADLGWSLEDIRRHFSIGCFPLHPYTTYLLANLSFTIGSNAIQFLRQTIVPFVQEQPAEIDGGQRLNYLYATVLVESFLENYSKDLQQQYKATLQGLSGSDNEDERLIVQALFLYWGSEGKLRKMNDQEDHEVILGHLTGLSKPRLASALERLTKTYKVISYQSTAKLYRFHQAGRNPLDLENEIEQQIENKPTSIQDVVAYVRDHYFDDKRIPRAVPARNFASEKRQVESDWKFEKHVSSPDTLSRTLSNSHLFQGSKYRGWIIYILAETQEELQSLRRNIQSMLDQSPVGDRVVIAIPNLETGDLDLHLQKYNTLKQFPSEKRQDYGEAFVQLRTEWEKDIRQALENIINDCTYYCKGIDRLTTQQRKNLDVVISHLLSQLYSFVPPIVDSLKSDHSTGNKIVKFVSKNLFTNDLTDQNISTIGYNKAAHETVIRQVYKDWWGILRYQGGKYHARPPKNAILKQAWDYIEEQAEQAKMANRSLPLLTLWKTLSAPPYGYSEYNFVVLLAGWLSYHFRTVDLNGRAQLSGNNVRVKTSRIKDWAGTDILDKPKDFVSKWVETHKAKIIFRSDTVLVPKPLQYPVPWATAQKYLVDLERYLNEGEPEDNEKAKLIIDRDMVKQACLEVETWFKPMQEAENLKPHTDFFHLIEVYPKLWNSPPAIDMSGQLSVNADQDQLDRQKQTQTKIQIYLEQKLTANVQTLTTPKECDDRQKQIKQTQEVLGKLPEQSSEFLEKLDQTLTEIEKRRGSLEQAKTPQSLLDGRIQAFLQQHSVPQATNTPLSIQERALEELAQLQRELQNNPNADLSQALKDCGKKIQQKIDAEQEKLKTLENDLHQVKQRTNLDRCRQTYDRLAPIFQESSSETIYRSLESIFDRLNADLQKLDKIQQQVDKSQSIFQCEQLLDELEQTQTQINHPEQFQSVINNLKKQIEDKINNWIRELEQFQRQLQTLTNLADIYQFQTNLLSTSDRYKDSTQENIFNTLNGELRQWLEFFQIIDNTPSNTLEEYQKKAADVKKWKEQQDQISPALQEQVTDHQTELQQEIETLKQTRIDEALKWWQELQEQASEIVILEGQQRFRVSQEIQKRLKVGWEKHKRFIPEKKAEAQELNRQCLKVLDEEKVDHIKQLFSQLTRSDRRQLIQELNQMLSAETEVF